MSGYPGQRYEISYTRQPGELPPEDGAPGAGAPGTLSYDSGAAGLTFGLSYGTRDITFRIAGIFLFNDLLAEGKLQDLHESIPT